jgi:hypothetical protein
MICNKKGCGGKNNSGVMADTAFLLCRDVISNLGRCDTCVVAGSAIVGVNAQVGKGYARKGGKVVDIVTGGAIQGRWHMIAGLSDTDLAVMATGTIVDIDTHVIKSRARKVRGVMAHDAILGGR